MASMAKAAALSSPSSPRLPSPPPIPEVQIGPKSPTLADSIAGGQIELGGQEAIDSGATRRIRPGTKSADMASGPPMVPLTELDSAFQLQEHLKSLFYLYTHPPDLNHTVPINKETAALLATPPPNVDRSLWLYELCRLLTNSLNIIIVAFFNDSPPCSSGTCPEMRASEWQYLCAVHDPPKSCCAIDYSCHTLDFAANMLTSSKNFPSRLSLGVNSESGGGTQQGLRHLTNIFRRLYRIFAHAWFQHRAMFWQVEGEYGLYIFFKTVCDAYHLIPEENYTVPAEAEGLEADSTPAESVSVIKREVEGSSELVEQQMPGAAPTQRRHKNTPSVGSFVNTVPEEDENEEASVEAGRDEEGETVLLGKSPSPGPPSPTKLPYSATGEAPDDPKPEQDDDSSKSKEQTDASPIHEHIRELAAVSDSTEAGGGRVDEKTEAKVLETEEEEEKEAAQDEEDPDKEAVVEDSKETVPGMEEKNEDGKETENEKQEDEPHEAAEKEV